MSADPRPALLTSLEQDLDVLITRLESGMPEQAFSELWGSCNETFAAFKDAHDARAEGDLSPELRAQMQAVFRLQVVVSSMASRMREDLAVEADKVANARARVDALAVKARVGKSCDLLG